MKIGVFDSGRGGELALKYLQQRYKQYKFIGYFDRVNAPYGNKAPEEILRLTMHGVSKLFDQNCHLVLLACNTASADSLRVLQAQMPDKKILGCLIPAVEAVAEAGGTHIGLIATQHTVRSQKYKQELAKSAPNATLYALPTPPLVPWIEAGLETSAECLHYLTEQINHLRHQYGIDTLILGCTHYHVFLPYLKQTFPHLNIIDSVQAQADKLGPYLQRHPELDLA